MTEHTVVYEYLANNHGHEMLNQGNVSVCVVCTTVQSVTARSLSQETLSNVFVPAGIVGGVLFVVALVAVIAGCIVCRYMTCHVLFLNFLILEPSQIRGRGGRGLPST